MQFAVRWIDGVERFFAGCLRCEERFRSGVFVPRRNAAESRYQFLGRFLQLARFAGYELRLLHRRVNRFSLCADIRRLTIAGGIGLHLVSLGQAKPDCQPIGIPVLVVGGHRQPLRAPLDRFDVLPLGGRKPAFHRQSQRLGLQHEHAFGLIRLVEQFTVVPKCVTELAKTLVAATLIKAGIETGQSATVVLVDAVVQRGRFGEVLDVFRGTVGNRVGGFFADRGGQQFGLQIVGAKLCPLLSELCLLSIGGVQHLGDLIELLSNDALQRDKDLVGLLVQLASFGQGACELPCFACCTFIRARSKIRLPSWLRAALLLG